jgi:hypothetical protein
MSSSICRLDKSKASLIGSFVKREITSEPSMISWDRSGEGPACEQSLYSSSRDMNNFASEYRADLPDV